METCINSWGQASQNMDQASKNIQNFLQKCRAGCIIDVSSILRNAEALREVLSNGGSLLHYAGTFSKPFTVFAAGSAALMAVQAALLVARDTLAEDKDFRTFALHTFLTLPEFVNYFLLGVSFTTLKVATLAGATFVAEGAAVLLTQSALLMGVCYLGLAAHGIYETELLSSVLGKDENAKEVVKGLTLLLQQKEMTPEEIKALNALLKQEGATREEQAALTELLEEGITLEEKDALIARLERQTSPECVEKLQKLDVNNKFELEFLAQEIREANYKAKINQKILLILGVITLLSTIVATVSTGGAANLFYIGGATMWLSQDSSALSKQLGDWFWAQNQGTSGLRDREFWAITAAGVISSPLWVIPALFYFECTQNSDG
ncbi:MAG: hypothetical protein K2X08_01750 [Chlamydiales bacterium]|nr:hypothetical protein [Chlamydiales bacterium]